MKSTYTQIYFPDTEKQEELTYTFTAEHQVVTVKLEKTIYERQFEGADIPAVVRQVADTLRNDGNLNTEEYEMVIKDIIGKMVHEHGYSQKSLQLEIYYLDHLLDAVRSL